MSKEETVAVFHGRDGDDERLIGAIWRAKVAKVVTEAIIVAACVFWVLWWFVAPDPEGNKKYVEAWIGDKAHSRFFRTDGREGSTFIYQTMPFFVVTILSFVVIGLRAFIKAKTAELRGVAAGAPTGWKNQWQMSTYPVWVDKSPFGILTASELLGIVAVTLLMTYHFSRIINISFTRIDNNTQHHHGSAPPPAKSWQKVNNVSFYFGRVAVVPFSLLWIPVSRGSPLLRLVGVPFERAVRYHIWLAVSMLVLVSLHSLGYVILYANTNRTHLIFTWATKQEKCSVVAGLVAWVIGLVIWATSLSFVRRRFYDIFFSVHHLYLLFSLFWLYHAVWNYHFFIVPIMLFFIDRFLRMVQSSRVVRVSSAKLLENGTVELLLPLNTNATKGSPLYNALSSWCIQIPGIAKLQWHFFSGASSPLDNTHELSIVIKPLGEWTNALRDQFSSVKKTGGSTCPFSFKARVEGPYGDESDFYLKYKSLVMVAGGIGLTPALAIIRDILYRYKDIKSSSSASTLPTSITLYHCIRKPEELCVLNTLYPNQILPGYETLGLRIRVHVYITSKNIQDYEGVLLPGDNSHRIGESLDLSKFIRDRPTSQPLEFYPAQQPQAEGRLSSIGSTGSTSWLAFTTIASFAGYFVLSGLANTYIVRSYTKHTFTNYNRAHVVVACMILGIVVCGGLVVLLWFHKLRRQSSLSLASVQPRLQSPTSSPSESSEDLGANYNGMEDGTSQWDGDAHIFSRPNWKDVFEGLVEHHRGECVGVLVSGSESMQEDIARECKRFSPFRPFYAPPADTSKPSEATMGTLLHFHSISFSL